MTPVDDRFCIGCGRHSEIGLHLEFTPGPEGSVESRVTVPRDYQGWRDVAHGGTVALLLDEAMAYAAGARGLLGVTADLRVRFRAPVPTQTSLALRAAVTAQRRHVLHIAATIHDQIGALLASAEGRFVIRGNLAPGERLGA